MEDQPPEFRVATVHMNGTTTVELGGELDLTTAPDLAARLEAVIDASSGAVAVDLAQITFLDSSGLEVLVAVHQRLRAEGRHLTVRRPCEFVYRVFETSGVMKVLDVQDPSAASTA